MYVLCFSVESPYYPDPKLEIPHPWPGKLDRRDNCLRGRIGWFQFYWLLQIKNLMKNNRKWTMIKKRIEPGLRNSRKISVFWRKSIKELFLMINLQILEKIPEDGSHQARNRTSACRERRYHIESLFLVKFEIFGIYKTEFNCRGWSPFSCLWLERFSAFLQ